MRRLQLGMREMKIPRPNPEKSGPSNPGKTPPPPGKKRVS
jgi:hypothetical protein